MISFTGLVGTTDTTSASTYGQSFTTLANNNSPQAVATGKSLVNSMHRYLLQKYFDNERSLAMDIVGTATLTFTGSLAVGATSATLTSAWTGITCQQFVNFSSGDQRMAQFIKNSATITWDAGLSHTATTSASTTGLRDYPIPATISKITDATLTVGQLVFTPKFVQSRIEWDYVNTIPYSSDIPYYVFIWNNTLGIWPIPPTANNVLTFNYKTRVPDMTFSDYSTGTIAAAGAAAGGYTVTGLSTNWVSSGGYPTGTNISYLNLGLRIDPPYGDGLWYPIQSFSSNTSLTLSLPIQNAPNITAASTYTIGQLPILQEDFHDMIVFGALMIYYSSIVKDVERYGLYKDLFNQRLDLMKDYLGTKAVSVDLEEQIILNNPNLFPYQSA